MQRIASNTVYSPLIQLFVQLVLTVVATASAGPQVLLGGYAGYAGYPLSYGSPLAYSYTPQVFTNILAIAEPKNVQGVPRNMMVARLFEGHLRFLEY